MRASPFSLRDASAVLFQGDFDKTQRGGETLVSRFVAMQTVMTFLLQCILLKFT
jgi:hypothetical protein